MIGSDGKHRKKCVYHSKDISKLIFLIHVLEHSSYECVLLGYFGTNYAKERPTKYRSQDPATKKNFWRQQEKKSKVQYAVYEIILQKNKN